MRVCVQACQSKMEAAFDVKWDEVVGFSKTPRLAEARQIAVRYLYECGMGYAAIGQLINRSPNATRKFSRAAERRLRGSTASDYMRVRVPEALPPMKPRTDVGEWHRQRILGDKALGMSAQETLRHWPYDMPVSLETVESVRRGA